MQAILLREAFNFFAKQGIAVKKNAPTVILDVSCGPGDYSAAWTSQIAGFLRNGMVFYCTDYRDGVVKETGETYSSTTAKKIRAAAGNGSLRLAEAPVATDADLFSGHDALMPPGKTADIVHWSHSGYHVRDALGTARNDPRAIEAGLHAAVAAQMRRHDQEIRDQFRPFGLEMMLGHPEGVVAALMHAFGASDDLLDRVAQFRLRIAVHHRRAVMRELC